MRRFRFFLLLLLSSFGAAAYEFEDFLKANTDKLWQMTEADVEAALPDTVEHGAGERKQLRLKGTNGREGEKVTFGGKTVSELETRYDGGRLSSLTLVIPYNANSMRSEREERREKERFTTLCSSFNPPAKDAGEFWQSLYRSDVLLNTVCMRGRYADCRLGSRSSHRMLGSLLVVELTPVGALDKNGDGESPRNFEDFLGRCGERIFEMTPEATAAFFSGKLQWNNSSRTQMRYAAPREGSLLRFAGLPVQEALFDLKDGKLDGLELSLFNQGDGGKAERKQLELWRKAAEEACEGICGGVGPKPGNIRLDGNTKLSTLVWNGELFDLMLKWDETKHETSFISLAIGRPGEFKNLRKASASGIKNIKELLERVVKSENGDMYLDVPMVNQGDKGYCSAASVSRVLLYYGIEADQHLLAKLANVDAENGASGNDIFDMLTAIRTKTRIQFQKLCQSACFTEVRALERLVADYNKQLKKMRKKGEAPLRMLQKTSGGRATIDLSAVVGGMYYDAFKELRMRDSGGMKSFERHINANIERGVPLLWSVLVLANTEPGAKIGEAGGHLRLIVGFNPKNREVIYSDSWGAGHELKRMSIEDAWAATVTLFVILPR